VTASQDGWVRVWNYLEQTCEAAKRLDCSPEWSERAPKGEGGSVDAISGRGTLVASSTVEISVTLHCSVAVTLSHGPPPSIALHPSGFHLLVGTSDRLRMYHLLHGDIALAREVAQLKQCRDVQFSHGGHLFAVAHSKTVTLFSTYTCEPLAPQPHLKGLRCRLFPPSLGTLLRPCRAVAPVACLDDSRGCAAQARTGSRTRESLSPQARVPACLLFCCLIVLHARGLSVALLRVLASIAHPCRPGSAVTP